MRRLHVTLIVLLLTLDGFHLHHVHGEEPLGGAAPIEDVEYKSVHLPLSAKSARTWITLRETMVKPPPDKTPFGKVIESLRAAPVGKNGKTSPLMIYVNPTSLPHLEMTMSTPVASTFVGEGEVTLHTYLGILLREFGWTHRVHDNLVVIDFPCDDCPASVEVGAAEAWSWLLLHEEVPLRFAHPTPIEDVVKAMQKGTVGKGPGGRGLVFYFDPFGLRKAEETPKSPVVVEMEHVPICTALGLTLKQLGLGFHVRDDGVVIITSFSASEAPLTMDEAEVSEDYQLANYTRFWREHYRREPIEERKEATKGGLAPSSGNDKSKDGQKTPR